MISFDEKGLRIKVGLPPSKNIIFIYFNESSLRMMKNAFYFMLQAPFILEIFTFLFWLFGCPENWLDKKIMVNSLRKSIDSH